MELLVVIAVIGILIAMLLPAFFAAWGSARRLQCSAHLQQIGLALESYEDAFEVLPAGTVAEQGPIANEEKGLHHSWLVRLLPYVDHRAAFDRVDFTRSVYDSVHDPLRKLYIDAFFCPAEIETNFSVRPSSYAGCHHDVEADIDETNHGAFVLNRPLPLSELSDGRSQTILVGEKVATPDDLGWMSGTSATLRNTGWPLRQSELLPEDVGGFGSHHEASVNFLFADGSVQSLGVEISPGVLRELAHRVDGAPLSCPPAP